MPFALDFQPDHARNSLDWPRNLIRLPIRTLAAQIPALDAGAKIQIDLPPTESGAPPGQPETQQQTEQREDKEQNKDAQSIEDLFKAPAPTPPAGK